MARGLTFCILNRKSRDRTSYVTKTRAVDQLLRYCEADLRLCIGKIQVFNKTKHGI